MMETNRHLVTLHIIVFIFGFTGILGELIDLPALSLVLNRMSLAAILLFIYLKWKKHPLLPKPKQILSILAVGAVVGAHWVTFFHAIKISTVSVTLACLASTSFMVALIEPLIFKRRVRIYELGLGLFVIAGLYLIFNFETDYTAGIITALISAFLAAVFSTLNGKLLEKNSAEQIALYEMLGGVLAVSLFMIATQKPAQSFLVLSFDDIAYLFLLGSICTAYPMVAIVKLLKHLTPYSVSLAINMEPVYGIILAVLFFKDQETMTLPFYLGTGMILAALFLDAILKRRKRKRAARNASLVQ